MFVDSHAHLDSPEYANDLDIVLQRARDARVQRILVIGSGMGRDGLGGAVRLAQLDNMLDASIGIHPHEARLATGEDFSQLSELSKQPEVVAWGEIGLDFHYHHSPQETQEQVFIHQLELARQSHLPVIIHTREAEDRTLQILKEYWADCGLGGIMHCFSGSLDLAQECLDMGFLISFSGILTFPKARTVQQVARIVPEHRLLIETDCPYLAPVPHRGRRNEPAFVARTADALAEIRGLSLETVGRLTTENYLRFSRREPQENPPRETSPPV